MMVRSSVLTILLAGLVGLTSLGCGAPPGSGIPGAPTPIPPVAIPPPPPADVASLGIEGHAIAYLLPPNSYGDVYGYHARFLIHETRGLVGATILNVWPVSPEDPDGGYSYGPQCFGRTVHVAAGETLETFFTDLGLASLGCRPEAWSTNLAEEIQLQVTYRDDTGHGGVVIATLEVIRP